MRRRSVVESYLPFGYLGVALVLVATLLPTALRPPNQQPPQSAEFSPDAPPDEHNLESILAALGRGHSGVGADAEGAGGAGPMKNTKTTFRPRSGACWGDPPRQIESVYSAPCVPAFVGNNGGKTWRGVTKDEIRIGVFMELTGTADTGPVPDDPQPGESENERTYRVLQAYFNRHYEFYGRRIRFYYEQNNGGDAAEHRNRVDRAMEKFQFFAALQETNLDEIDELMRLKVPTFTLAQASNDFYAAAQRRPYLWSFTPDSTVLMKLGAEYLCKKLAHKPPKFTDDITIDQSKPRKFGIIQYDLPAYQPNPPLFRRLVKEQCNVDIGTVVGYNYDQAGPAGISTGIARLKADNVTTIVYLGDLLAANPWTNQADAARYYPEWYLPGFGGVETSQWLARSYNANEWKHAFGFSMYEVPAPVQETECRRAYHEIDPSNNPNDGMCVYMWGHMVQLFGAIQMAGPKLNPTTFSQGLLSLPRSAPEPEWRVAGAYGPNDYTYPDYAAEMWWNPNGVHPDGVQGAYCFVRKGKRYTYGQWPKEDPMVFQPDKCVTTLPPV